ncbi:hypothetical protein TSAR_004965 [Trichomalopsis sarcophagae]|uniref:Uncharacterized protein n=1 Tax=Trichomalopsis sarcophagae TaxID=543379 RepID=A0A232EGK6_9HYME|nr:hypothetical protein TSAR_004965 [Trichomalopsis sarcophagae]
MYFEDYENTNLLGSHEGLSKSGAVYIGIPLKVENIFLFILFNTIDRQVFKNPVIFFRAVEELNYLIRAGIDIDLANNRHEKVYFKLALFIGDNFEVCSILGLSESFKSKFFCHHCIVNQSEKNTVFLKKDCNLRTVNNYDEQN